MYTVCHIQTYVILLEGGGGDDDEARVYRCTMSNVGTIRCIELGLFLYRESFSRWEHLQ